MKKKLLLILAEHLEGVEEDQFDMCSLIKDALAYASTIPAFKKLGLKAHYDESTGERWFTYKGHRYQNDEGLHVAEAFFDISSTHALYLFSHRECDENGRPGISMYRPPGTSRPNERKYEPPRFAAARIRSFVLSQERALAPA